MVTVESRFVDLQDNFLESLGINFGNPFNSNLPNPINDIGDNGTASRRRSGSTRPPRSNATAGVDPGFNPIDPTKGAAKAEREAAPTRPFTMSLGTLDRAERNIEINLPAIERAGLLGAGAGVQGAA